jgi:uncharacterized BrkB/YihY/UPF0761 family membrane protein
MSTEFQPPEDNREEAIPTLYVVIGMVVLILIGIGFTVGIVLLAEYFPNQLEAIRDVFIIALALESCVFGIVLMLMLIMLIRLVNTVEFEIKPILEQTYETMGTGLQSALWQSERQFASLNDWSQQTLSERSKKI